MSELRYCCIVADDAGKIVREDRGDCPLKNVSVTGLIRDAVAQYTLEQTYVNPLRDAAIETVYTFPLYEGMAVCGFEAEVDGRKIVGRVQEKVAARKEYESAKKAGKVASLLDEETPDTFQASVCNIPPSKTVAIRITLVSEIKQDGDENQVRFVMPTTIAPRYGLYPVVESSSSIDASSTVLSVNMGCAMSKAITSIQSSSRTIEVHLGTTSSDPSSTADSFNPNRARVSLTADSLLDRDLVIIVQALGLDEPRALVERHPKDGTHAISLTFAPRFALNPMRKNLYWLRLRYVHRLKKIQLHLHRLWIPTRAIRSTRRPSTYSRHRQRCPLHLHLPPFSHPLASSFRSIRLHLRFPS